MRPQLSSDEIINLNDVPSNEVISDTFWNQPIRIIKK